MNHFMGPAVRSHPPIVSGIHGQILKQREAWNSWTELTIRVTNLPSDITTWELWQTFEREGTIAFIEIFENRQRSREGTAKVRFSPPPHHAFWTEEYAIVQRTEGDGCVKVMVELEPQKRLFRIQSPIWKNISYPETMHLYPSSVSFGVMHDEFTMMDMYNAQALPQTSSVTVSRAKTSFKVDLLRGRIVISFQVRLKSPQSILLSEVAKKAHIGPLDRINTYMFTIPLTQLRKIYRTENGEKQWSLIISLKSPPVFFRKRLDPKASHAKRSLVWSEFDTWFRQTDIVYDPRRLETAEVALRKDLAVIDIGRWTTYRIIFNKSQDEPGVYDSIQNALQDYNIEIVHLDHFEIIPGPSTAEIDTIWSLVDPQKSEKMGAKTSLSESIAIVDLHLPFEVRYQLEVCISHGILNEYNIKSEFVNALADLTRRDQAKARNVLEYAMEQEKHIFNPMMILNDKEALAYSSKSKIPYYCAYSRKATVTPTTIYYSSPAVETTNRVIRKYAQLYGDRFLRVQFTDEKIEGAINSCSDKARNDEIYTRVWRTLRNGIRLGDRHYQFLAFGNSQFRQNGAYFFCPTDDLSCYGIRHWMGDFTDIKVVAKYAARLGQCFSTTRAIHRCRPNIVRIEDVQRNGYCFTDGIGKISEIFASMIAAELNLPPANAAPSAFQFRLGGCKGVLAKWPDVKGLDVHIRKSQFKFNAIYNGLEIIRWSQYSLAALNRQTIQILSSLGVRDEVFNQMLSEQLSNYQAAMTDKRKALDLLSRYVDDNQMTIIIAGMVLNGFMETGEPFLMSILHLWRAWSIKLLKEKARIIVENGAFLLGITDETGTLLGHQEIENDLHRIPSVSDLPQIFVQIPDRNRKGGYVVIEGLCLVGRNPSLHPGDIRVVQAVNNPSLYHLKDVLVFSQQGDRDVPSMCSGGDLDGDDFFVIWDKDLIPIEWNPEPMDYVAPKAIELDRPVEIQDVMKFFVRFMKNDTLGSIAHAHLAQSDFFDCGIKDSRCLELAELHSKAVDYIKTGEPAELPKFLRPRKWPHFMKKRHKPKEQIYRSEKILGQLYDKVESVNFVPHYTQPFDRRISDACTPSADTLEISRKLKAKYDTAMRRIMAQQEIETEFEVWSTFSLSKPRVGSDYKMQEELANIAGALKDRFRRLCIDAAGGTDPEHLEPFVAAMYQTTREEMEIALTECGKTKNVGGRAVPVRKMEPKYMPLISFPWLFYEVLGRLASGVALREDLEESGLSVLSNPVQPERLRKIKLVDVSDFDDCVETEQGTIHLGEELDLECFSKHHTQTTSSINDLLLINISESSLGYPKGATKSACSPSLSGVDELIATTNDNEVKTASQIQKASTSIAPLLFSCQQLAAVRSGGDSNLEEVDIEEAMSYEAKNFLIEKLTRLIERRYKGDQPAEEEELRIDLEHESPLEKLTKLTGKRGADKDVVEVEEVTSIIVEEDSPLTKLTKLTGGAEMEDEEFET